MGTQNCAKNGSYNSRNNTNEVTREAIRCQKMARVASRWPEWPRHEVVATIENVSYVR